MGPSLRRCTTGNKTKPVVVCTNDKQHKYNTQQWKYVDNTTAAEVVAKGKKSHVQEIADSVTAWSRANRVPLNIDKCKDSESLLPKSEESSIL